MKPGCIFAVFCYFACVYVDAVSFSSVLTDNDKETSESLENKNLECYELSFLRQMINQETVIRLTLVKNVHSLISDVNLLQQSNAASEVKMSELQNTIESLQSENRKLKSNDVNNKARILELERNLQTLNLNFSMLQDQITLFYTEMEENMREISNITNIIAEENNGNKENQSVLSDDLRKIESKFDASFKTLENKLTKLSSSMNTSYLMLLNSTKKYVDCSDILNYQPSKKNQDGVYTIYPDHTYGKEVYCDMTTDGGGWTVIQKREDNSTDFYRTWKEYKEGFGNPSRDYWIGNDDIYQLTKNSPQKRRIDLQRYNGDTGYAEYSNFAVKSEISKYKLTVSGYNHGTLDDSMTYHNGMMFSTKDEDNDEWSLDCANDRVSGWWFKVCAYANLNGLLVYASSAVTSNKYLYWYRWKSGKERVEALKLTKIMVRPSSF